MEAGEILFQNNPMSSICSVVCIHEQQCAGHCIRGKKDSPHHFSSIEHYLSDMYLDRMEITKPEPEPKDKKVAVIGAGPAGMTVAIQLAQKGYPVTIFEWEDRIGGIMKYGIPEFRLPKSVLERFRKRMEEMGTPRLLLPTSPSGWPFISLRWGFGSTPLPPASSPPSRTQSSCITTTVRPPHGRSEFWTVPPWAASVIVRKIWWAQSCSC